ncbi:PilZ domain-containing protein [bacterium]|nr:PilZ domain-containing protein [bacterium]
MRKESDAVAKRKYPRKSFRKNVSFMCDGKSSLGVGVEIGEGGLSFSSDDKIDVNKKLILNFFLSDKDFFSVRVTLLNVLNTTKSFTYGASFDDVSIALKRQIRAYVARSALNS